MKLKDIAVKNLIRRKSKAGFILAGLMIGVATVVAVISFSDAMTRDINHKLEKYGANILILPKTENLSLSYGGLSLGGVPFDMQQIRQQDLDRVASIKNARNIAAMGPIVVGGAHIDGRRVLVAGIDFESTYILKPWWKLNGAYPDGGQAVAGSEAARLLNLRQGDPIDVKGHALTVSGVLAPTGSQDDHLVFTRIETAQKVFEKPGTVSMVEVAALCNACPVDDMVGQISAALPGAKVMAIQQVVKGRMDTLAQFKSFSFGISIVVVLIGGLMVLVTLMGSVRERTHEIGIFRAIGFRRGHLMGIVFMETLILAGLAGVLGYAVGIGGTRLGLALFTTVQAAALPFSIELAAAAVLMSVLIGLAASAYPALMAARLDPNEALRTL